MFKLQGDDDDDDDDDGDGSDNAVAICHGGQITSRRQQPDARGRKGGTDGEREREAERAGWERAMGR